MQYLIYVLIPSIFLLLGGLAKIIVRRQITWSWSDWYLGIELVIAAMSTGVMHGFDLDSKISRMAQANNMAEVKKGMDDLKNLHWFLAASFVLFFLVVIAHRKHEPTLGTNVPFAGKTSAEKWKIVWLAGICNVVGYALFAAFILGVKGLSEGQ